MKVRIVTEWHDAETKDIVGVFLNFDKACAAADALVAKWNAECPGRDGNGNRHKWARAELRPKFHDPKHVAIWSSQTAWSGIYITEHEVIVK